MELNGSPGSGGDDDGVATLVRLIHYVTEPLSHFINGAILTSGTR